MPTYIYNLPFEVNRDLCRLLDIDDLWKELAGVYMKFKAFDINEMEQLAKRQQQSPTEILLTRWGQLNHKTEELFVLLYKMQHVPAMLCLKDQVEERFLKLLHRFGSVKKTVDGKIFHMKNILISLIPVPILLTRWGQLNHKTEELFVLLYKMQHVPAMLCLKDQVEERFLKLLHRFGSVKKTVDVNGNNPEPPVSKPDGSQDFIPRPVVELELGVPQSSSGVVNGHSPTESTHDSTSVTSSTQDSHSHSHSKLTGSMNEEIIKQVSAIPQIKYEELKEATNNWHESEWKLLTVAVKKLKNDGKNRELIREMCLNQYRHDNILPLYGFSLGGSEACLVYQLMTGGSLEQRLRCKTHFPPLTWSLRHRIAHGVARGLTFLHTMTGTPLIHGDIKPANILLDQCGIPKIGDFGLARKGPYGEERTHLKVSRVHGTRPYLPDEYLRSHCLSPAVDVFSFGVVLMEMATCLSALDRNRPAALLSDFIQLQANNMDDLGESTKLVAIVA
ncbi:protein kinase domain-containing protein [Phthorimaea operculella]|nr:protein kinase domain-containing protein [Phthorimaea operculella]